MYGIIMDNKGLSAQKIKFIDNELIANAISLNNFNLFKTKALQKN